MNLAILRIVRFLSKGLHGFSVESCTDDRGYLEISNRLFQSSSNPYAQLPYRVPSKEGCRGISNPMTLSPLPPFNSVYMINAKPVQLHEH